MSVRIEFDKKEVEYVIDTYVNEKKSIYFLADQYGVSTVTILRLLIKHKVKLRKRGRQKGSKVGPYVMKKKVKAKRKQKRKSKPAKGKGAKSRVRLGLPRRSGKRTSARKA